MPLNFFDGLNWEDWGHAHGRLVVSADKSLLSELSNRSLLNLTRAGRQGIDDEATVDPVGIPNLREVLASPSTLCSAAMQQDPGTDGFSGFQGQSRTTTRSLPGRAATPFEKVFSVAVVVASQETVPTHRHPI